MQAEAARPGVAEAKGEVAYALGHNLGLGASLPSGYRETIF